MLAFAVGACGEAVGTAKAYQRRQPRWGLFLCLDSHAHPLSPEDLASSAALSPEGVSTISKAISSLDVP